LSFTNRTCRKSSQSPLPSKETATRHPSGVRKPTLGQVPDDLKVKAESGRVVSRAGKNADPVRAVQQRYGLTFERSVKLPQEKLDFLEARATRRSGRAQADIGGSMIVTGRSADLEHAANATVINGGGTTQCVTGSDNAASTVLRGFTIQNGWDGGSDGGGGMVLENSSAVIVQCTFVNNKAANFGGAVSVRGTGSPQFINCIFEGNGEATGNDPLGGGVLYAYRGSPTFVNCLFNGNKAGEGGVALVYFGNPTFINCTFVNNQAKIGRGGAIYDPNGQATLKNCILWNNTTTRGVGEADQIGAGGGGRSLARYCDIQAGWPGTNIINADPMFTGDITQGYYTLQSGSPCKETGENAALPPDIGNLDWDLDTSEPIPLDLALHERASGPAVDMGAYEYFDIVPGGPE